MTEGVKSYTIDTINAEEFESITLSRGKDRLMGIRIMYCPGCDKRLEIKENTKLDGMLCPICNEACLSPAEETAANSAFQLYEFYRETDYRNRTTKDLLKINDFHFYRNSENFHLFERKN